LIVAIFVINEWLPEDCSGANGIKKQREAFDAIVLLASSSHTVIVMEGSPFEVKFWRLCRENRDIVIRGIAREYVLGLRQNIDRCLVLKPEEGANLPEALAASTKEDDHYLLRSQLAVPNSILVTTDGDLCQAAKTAGLTCLSREEFLEEYF
jgi:hypothetical protein